MMHVREERIRNDLERAEGAKAESENRRCSSTRRSSRTRATEAGRIIDEARQAADRCGASSSRGPTTRPARSWRAPQADIALQHERALSELRTEVADLSIDARRADRREATSTAPRRCSSSTASSTRSGATRRWPTASRSTHRHCSQIAEAEGHLGEIEDELFRFARIVDGNDELRMALSDRSLPAERRSRDRRGAPRGPRDARDGGDRLVHRRRPDAVTTSSRSSSASSSSPPRPGSTRSPRCGRRYRSTTRRCSKLAAALSQATDKQRRGQGRRRREGARRHRRNHRRHRDRRHRAPPPRAVEGDDLETWPSSPSTRRTSLPALDEAGRGVPPVDRAASASGGCSKSVTASRASPACPTPP